MKQRNAVLYDIEKTKAADIRFFIINQNNMIMIYGYIRVSSDKQTVENQRFRAAAE